MRAIGTNEATRYELVATHAGRTLLVGYTPRNNKRGIIDMLLTGDQEPNRRIDRLSRATGIDVNGWYVPGRIESKLVGSPCIIGGEWVVKFSGRTQRDVRSSVELTESIYDGVYDA